MTIKRYRIEAQCEFEFGQDAWRVDVEEPDGEWVRYTDHLAIVAAAYRDAAEAFTRPEAKHAIAEHIAKRTPADAQAALTAIERAAYERGVRDAALKAYQWGDADDGQDMHDRILALLTQEGR